MNNAIRILIRGAAWAAVLYLAACNPQAQKRVTVKLKMQMDANQWCENAYPCSRVNDGAQIITRSGEVVNLEFAASSDGTVVAALNSLRPGVAFGRKDRTGAAHIYLVGELLDRMSTGKMTGALYVPAKTLFRLRGFVVRTPFVAVPQGAENDTFPDPIVQKELRRIDFEADAPRFSIQVSEDRSYAWVGEAPVIR